MFLFPFIFVPPPKQTYFKRNESCKLETQGIVLAICVSVFMCKCVFVCCHPFSRVEYRKGQLGPHQLPVYTSFSHSHLWGAAGIKGQFFYSIHNECNNLKVHSADMVAIFSIWTKKSVWFLSDGSAIGDRLGCSVEDKVVRLCCVGGKWSNLSALPLHCRTLSLRRWPRF